MFILYTHSFCIAIMLMLCTFYHMDQINPEQTKWNQNVLQIKTKTISFSSHTYQNFLNASMNP